MRSQSSEARYLKCTCGAVLHFGAETSRNSGRCMYCNQKEEKMTPTSVSNYVNWKKRNRNSR